MHNTHRIILAALVAVGFASATWARPAEKITITIDKTVEHVVDSPRSSKKPTKPIQTPSGDMDAHFIKVDEYFASLRPIKGGGASEVQIARMLQPASDASKGEAQFMDSHKGTEFWTRTFWKTRPATAEDLKLGATVIYWGRYAKDHVYFAPRNEKEARNVAWKLNKITDVSDLFKGQVTVAGNKKVSVDAIRVFE